MSIRERGRAGGESREVAERRVPPGREARHLRHGRRKRRLIRRVRTLARQIELDFTGRDLVIVALLNGDHVLDAELFFTFWADLSESRPRQARAAKPSSAR